MRYAHALFRALQIVFAFGRAVLFFYCWSFFARRAKKTNMNEDDF
jgi:hypothetical protein